MNIQSLRHTKVSFPHIRWQSNNWFIALHALTSLMIFWVGLQQSHKYLNDDTLITLTFVKNIVLGRGFVYNQAPAVLGTTTPLLTLILSFLSTLLPQIKLTHLAVAFTAACWAAIPWIFYIFRDYFGLSSWATVLIGWIVLVSGWPVLLGMEAYLFEALLVLSMGFFYAKKYLLAGLVTGLLYLTRGEGALVFGLMGLLILGQSFWETKDVSLQMFKAFLKPALLLFTGFVVPVAAWSIYSFHTFGSLFPNTMSGKISQAASGKFPLFIDVLRTKWVLGWGNAFKIPGLPFINIWWIFVLIGLIYSLIYKRKMLIFLGWIVLFISGYTFLRVSAYGWYQFPIYFVLNLFAALGLVCLLYILRRWIKINYAALFLYGLLVFCSLYIFARPGFKQLMASSGDARGASYTTLAHWLRINTRPEESVAYVEVGYVGFYTNNRIIDLAGLVTPSLNNSIAKGDYALGFWQYKPDYYIYYPAFDWLVGDVYKNPNFIQQYQPVVTLPSPGSEPLTIYKRLSAQ